MQLEDITPPGAVRIPLRARDGSIRAYALIDADDAAWANQWRWSLSTGGYVHRGTFIGGVRRTHRLHRELLGLVPGDGLEADHINHDRLDNRRSNLRVVSRSGNQQNRSGNRQATSSYRGVSRAAGGRWQAHIKVNGKGINLGSFDDERVAGEAARLARQRYFPYTND